jgi:hypothetical protein
MTFPAGLSYVAMSQDQFRSIPSAMRIHRAFPALVKDSGPVATMTTSTIEERVCQGKLSPGPQNFNGII